MTAAAATRRPSGRVRLLLPVNNDSSVRSLNQRIAGGYDAWPWIQGYDFNVDPMPVLAVALPYGAAPKIGDVLDIGCGTGALLAQAAQQCSGRVVGTDISAESCARAREAVRTVGNRAEILHADIIELTPTQLGTFDLIYCTGVLTLVPAKVRRHIIELIGACLRPGAVAILSYYSGVGPALRGEIGRSLRARTSGIKDPRLRAAAARTCLEQIRVVTEKPTPYGIGLRDAFHYIDSVPDRFLWAEFLNEVFEPVSTAEIEHAFATMGVEFATYLSHDGFDAAYTSAERALLAERLDLSGGEYHYALFVKPSLDRQSVPASASRNHREMPFPKEPGPARCR